MGLTGSKKLCAKNFGEVLELDRGVFYRAKTWLAKN